MYCRRFTHIIVIFFHVLFKNSGRPTVFQLVAYGISQNALHRRQKTLVTEQFLCIKKTGLLFEFRFRFGRWRHSSSPLLSLPLYVCSGARVMYVLQPLCDRALTHFHRLAGWHCFVCPEQRDREAEQQTALCRWEEAIFRFNGPVLLYCTELYSLIFLSYSADMYCNSIQTTLCIV